MVLITGILSVINAQELQVSDIRCRLAHGAKYIGSDDIALYKEGSNLIFMNSENYDQFEVPEELMGESALYLQDNMQVTVNFIEGKPIGVNLPPQVVLEVKETEPSIKNQTATTSYKPCVLENGIKTTIPPFVSAGEKIVVSTIDNSYVERAK